MSDVDFSFSALGESPTIFVDLEPSLNFEEDLMMIHPSENKE